MGCTCKEEGWLKRLLSKFPVGYELSNRMIVLTNSQSKMKVPSNGSIKRRNRHIHITFRYVSDVTRNGEATLLYVPPSEMVEDLLNKQLGRENFGKWRTSCQITMKVEI